MKIAGAGNAAAKRDHFGIDERDDVGEPGREIGGEVLPSRERVRVARLRGFADFLRTELVAIEIQQRLRGKDGATANACRIKPVPEACASKQPIFPQPQMKPSVGRI